MILLPSTIPLVIILYSIILIRKVNYFQTNVEQQEHTEIIAMHKLYGG